MSKAAQTCAAGTGGLEGACTCRGGHPKAVSKPWKDWDKKKEVHPLVVTVPFSWVLTEAVAEVDGGLASSCPNVGATCCGRTLQSLSRCQGVPSTLLHKGCSKQSRF